MVYSEAKPVTRAILRRMDIKGCGMIDGRLVWFTTWRDWRQREPAVREVGVKTEIQTRRLSNISQMRKRLKEFPRQGIRRRVQLIYDSCDEMCDKMDENATQ